MRACYKYTISFIYSIFPRKRTTMVIYALDAEDLAEQFYAMYHHVDYEIISKEYVERGLI